MTEHNDPTTPDPEDRSSSHPPAAGGKADPPPGGSNGSHGLHKLSTATLVVAALGVVFGDIGTSPIYTLKECFSPASPHHIAATQGNILGVVSLVLWALILLICVKYLVYILRADNKGEGGVLSLMVLAAHGMAAQARRRRVIVILGLFGAALLFGDGIITPAVAELLDSPGLTWAVSNPAILSRSALSHDGVDALRISSSGSPPGEFKVLITGPGVASWWSTSSSSGMDDTPFTLPGSAAVGPWKRYLLPIPSGDHVVRFPVPSVGYMNVDEIRFDPSVTLSVADALDLPPGTEPIVSNPSGIGASTWPGLTDQPSDALLLMPGYANHLRVQVPLGSTLSARVKGIADSSLFSFGETSGLPAPSSGWRTITFVASNSVMIPLTAGSAPVLLDQLTITPATPLEQYFPWAADQGLPGAQQDPESDPDKDGFNNALEYALNSNPLENNHIPYATATSPGLPIISLSKNASTQVATVSVTYWKRSHQKAILETAVDPGGTLSTAHPFGWEPSPKAGTATSPGPAGWERIIWQSTAGSVPGARMSFRVRYEIP